MNEDQKSLVKQVLVGTRTGFTWGDQRARAYLRTLREQSGNKDIQISIPLRRDNNINKILDWIEEYDHDFKIFSDFYKDFEKNRKKASSIYKIKEETFNVLREQISELTKTTYSVQSVFEERQSTGLQIGEMIPSVEGNLELLIYQNTHTPTNYIIDKVDEELKNILLRKISSDYENVGLLNKVTVRFSFQARAIHRALIEPRKRTLTVMTDIDRISEDGENYEETDFSQRFREIIETSLQKIGIEDATRIRKEIMQQSAITDSVFQGLYQANSNDFVSIPDAIIYHIANREGQMSETATLAYEGQTINALLPDLYRYYAHTGSLFDFLMSNPNYNPEISGSANLSIKRLKDVKPKGGGIYMFFIRERKKGDPKMRIFSEVDQEIEVNQGRKIFIDYIKLKIELPDGIVKVASKETTEAQDEFIRSQLHRLI